MPRKRCQAYNKMTIGVSSRPLAIVVQTCHFLLEELNLVLDVVTHDETMLLALLVTTKGSGIETNDV